MALRRSQKAAVYKHTTTRVKIARVVYDTRFDRFLDARSIPVTRLAVVSGHSRQHIFRLRSNQVDATVTMIRNLTAACIVIAGDNAITPDDLFDLKPDAEAITAARSRDEQRSSSRQ